MSNNETAAAQPAEKREMSVRQRGLASRNGAAAGSIIYGKPDPQASKEKKAQPRRNPQASHYSSPSEFLGGPSKPGKVNTGIRRNENANKDSVGFMLTDEYFMSGAQNKRTDKPKVSRHNKSAMTHGLQVTEEPPPFRSGCKITHVQGPMDCPYFEDNDPKPPRDEPAPTGKRHVKPRRNKDDQIFLEPGSPDAKPLPKTNRTCKANKSVDVTNLSRYTAEELKEAPERQTVLGPRKFVAPDMPPAKPPAIKPINTAAKQDHDVLGDGRFGKPEEAKPAGKGQGSCRPPKQQANLFAGPPPKKKGGRGSLAPESKGNILKYYDPATDNAADFAPPPSRHRENKSNKESKPEPEKPVHKNTKSNVSSQKNLW
ncbi:hypothetical protein AGDE_13701 [Angomonas deanei]|uniref:Uncharacterized protein n=1 Tax=Angomonas deanei TaxID=59799 RepID=A0A7G2C0L4_9TRYP|nr:hypothetical protein AGDE_13701 [Angomonas deanei]CAD2213196.1 hypothetical protein, conserved [Angomonas deanei]|eukprot:EPY21918.1 hypothetical protein AGDE_13701 [Angomonas deanei]